MHGAGMGKGDSGARSTEVAEYIGSICGEMKTMAQRAQLPLLAYTLGMAHQAANEHSHSQQVRSNAAKLQRPRIET